MSFPERFSALPAYPFARLRALLDGHAPGGAPVSLSIGEPQHPFPAWLGEAIAEESAGFGHYPDNAGSEALRGAIAGWIARRHGVEVDPGRQVLALNGSREGLFTALLALVPETVGGRTPAVLMPNPFYQVYAAGALAAGAEPVYVPATAETGFLPDFAALDDATLARAAALVICSPSNPQGAVAGTEYLADLIALAERRDIRVIADECYSELYRHAPPPGILPAARAAGAGPERVVAINSLSKRSNVPGLRAGYAAGGPDSIGRMLTLRAYGGAPPPGPLQGAAARLWADEDHVAENRARYRRKYDMADRLLGTMDGYQSPEAGFFLWLAVADGERAALSLWRRAGLRTLPGAYLGRAGPDGANPGQRYLRVALVAGEDALGPALTRLRETLEMKDPADGQHS